MKFYQADATKEMIEGKAQVLLAKNFIENAVDINLESEIIRSLSNNVKEGGFIVYSGSTSPKLIRELYQSKGLEYQGPQKILDLGQVGSDFYTHVLIKK